MYNILLLVLHYLLLRRLLLSRRSLPLFYYCSCCSRFCFHLLLLLLKLADNISIQVSQRSCHRIRKLQHERRGFNFMHDVGGQGRGLLLQSCECPAPRFFLSNLSSSSAVARFFNVCCYTACHFYADWFAKMDPPKREYSPLHLSISTFSILITLFPSVPLPLSLSPSPSPPPPLSGRFLPSLPPFSLSRPSLLSISSLPLFASSPFPLTPLCSVPLFLAN